MSEFYIASFSLDSDELYHYGRPGMKWYQHIFGKEASARRSAKKEAKNIIKRQKGNLKTAKKIHDAYVKTDIKKKDYEKYKADIANIIKKNVSDPKLIEDLIDSAKKVDKILEKQNKANMKFYEYEGKDNKKAAKYDKIYSSLYDDFFKASDEETEKMNAIIKDVFGTYYDAKADKIGSQYYSTGFGYVNAYFNGEDYEKHFKDFIKEGNK